MRFLLKNFSAKPKLNLYNPSSSGTYDFWHSIISYHIVS